MKALQPLIKPIDKISLVCVLIAVVLIFDAVVLRILLNEHHTFMGFIRAIFELFVAASLLAGDLPKLLLMKERRIVLLRRLEFVFVGMAVICFIVECLYVALS